MTRNAWLAIAFGSGLLVAAVISRAQVDEPSACEQACDDAMEACVTACAARPDPIECEARCRDDGDACRERCR